MKQKARDQLVNTGLCTIILNIAIKMNIQSSSQQSNENILTMLIANQNQTLIKSKKIHANKNHALNIHYCP